MTIDPDLLSSLGTYVGRLPFDSMFLLPLDSGGSLGHSTTFLKNYFFIRKCTVNFYITRALPQCALSRIVLLACLILALHIALFSTVT